MITADGNLTPNYRFHFQEDKSAGELAFFQEERNKPYERTYGWTWLLKLQQELLQNEDSESEVWSRSLQPLADHLVIIFRFGQCHLIRIDIASNSEVPGSFVFQTLLQFPFIDCSGRLLSELAQQARLCTITVDSRTVHAKEVLAWEIFLIV